MTDFSRFLLFAVFSILLAQTPVVAQDFAMASSANHSTPFTRQNTNTNAVAKKEPVVVTKRAQKISAAYQGYAIEIAKSELPLLSDDVLFRQFGNLRYDQNEDGTYSYLVLTPFQKKKSVKKFYERIIKEKAPESKIVKYKSGNRKK